MTSLTKFYTWTRENRILFKREIFLPFSEQMEEEKIAPGKNFVKISLSYAILLGKLKLFRLTPIGLFFATLL